jgi:modification methylase ecoRI
MANNQLSQAKKGKKDEFYTQRADIEAELRHYRGHFAGKTVLCNCDDPRMSHFFYYFVLNFHHLGLKKLITTCYKNQDPNSCSENISKQAVYLVYEGEDIGSPPNPNIAGLVHPMQGDGDFRSPECIKFLEEADIIVTNPPFSLFREYVAQLIEYGKKFIIIGNINAVTYKEIFPLIQTNQIWLGPSIHSGDREFEVPSSYPLTAAGIRIDDQGRRYIRVKGVRWFTNLDFPQRHQALILHKKYRPEEYPHYDNYGAINVDKTADIPCDYDGVMGVPITYLDKHNPDQFEIIGATESEGRGFSAGLWDESSKVSQPLVNGERKYKRIFIRKRK